MHITKQDMYLFATVSCFNTRLLFATDIFDNEVNGDKLQQGDSFIIL